MGKELSPERKAYLKEYHKTYKRKDKDYYKNYDKGEERAEYIKTWRKNNKSYNNEYRKKRNQTDPLFKLKGLIRSRINDAMKSKGFKKFTKTHLILGCTYEALKAYLEAKFEPWMSWDNYGKYKQGTANFGWDIDHIIPQSSAQTEDDVIRLNHYTNLQPLCSYINRDIKKAINDETAQDKS